MDILEIKVQSFHSHYFHENNEAEENRRKESDAAIKIQSWYRGCLVRFYLSYLHKKAIIIQKIWRGFLAKARVRQMVKAAYFIMKMNFYEAMAVRIQKRWRGFYSRKYIHNFYERKSYLMGIIRKNELIRVELDEIMEQQERERRGLAIVKEQRATIQQAYRFHHLLSTEQIPGVFNSPFRQPPHEMELLLRQVKYHTPAAMTPGGGPRLPGILGPAARNFTESMESPRIKFTETCTLKPMLPPISNRKSQVTIAKTCTFNSEG